MTTQSQLRSSTMYVKSVRNGGHKSYKVSFETTNSQGSFKNFCLGQSQGLFFCETYTQTYEKSEYDFKMALAPLSTHRGTRVQLERSKDQISKL